MFSNYITTARFIYNFGANRGNRTLVTSLEDWASTAELCSHIHFKMVNIGGVEPPTYGLEVRYSIHLSYISIFFQ